MYCVRCGVKLQDGVKSCPLCNTPVMIESSELPTDHKYSDIYPEAKGAHNRFLFLGLVTTIMIIGALVCLIVCLTQYGRLYWSALVMISLAFTYVVAVVPFWFNRFRTLIFVPVCVAATAGYLVFLYFYTGNIILLSFALPVCLYVGILAIIGFVLFRYIKRKRLYLIGGLFIVIGASSILIEFIQTLTFKTAMFTWSLYSACFFGLVGIFLLVAASIPSLRHSLEKRFFI